jgi:hypothetical protein
VEEGPASGTLREKVTHMDYRTWLIVIERATMRRRKMKRMKVVGMVFINLLSLTKPVSRSRTMAAFSRYS